MRAGKDGGRKETYARGMELRARVTLFAEGCRGSLSEARLPCPTPLSVPLTGSEPFRLRPDIILQAGAAAHAAAVRGTGQFEGGVIVFAAV